MKDSNQKTIYIIWQGVYPWDVRLEKLIRALAQKYRIILLTKGKPELSLDESTALCRIFRVGFYGFMQKSPFRKIATVLSIPVVFNPFWILRALWTARLTKPDLIIVRDLPMMWLGIMLSRIHDASLVFDMAENYPAALIAYNKKIYKPFLFKNGVLPRAYERWAILASDHVFVVAEEQRERLEHLGTTNDKISLVLNTPVLENFPPPTHNPNNKTILYTGKIDIHRGIESIIKGMALILERYPAAKLILAGDGTEVTRLKSLCNLLKIGDNVIFLGWVSHSRIYEEIQSASLCVIPHLKSEHTDTTIPNKLFDYMALGKPILSTNLNPVVRIIGEYGCGEIYPSGDSLGFSQAVNRLWDNPATQFLGTRGREAVYNKYNWYHDESRLLKALESLLATQQERRASAVTRNHTR